MRRLIVILDIGETIRDDSRYFAGWAAWMGVPPHTFSATLGALRYSGHPTNAVFQVFRPGVRYEDLLAEREASGYRPCLERDELYEDVIPALAKLSELDTPVAIAGNQDAGTTECLRRMELPVRFVESSATLGTSKPESGFFRKLIRISGYDAEDIVYVGDNYRNDVEAAKVNGLTTALLRRGPWAHLWLYEDLDVSAADYVVDSLLNLVDVVELLCGQDLGQ
jgi:HAD superfamily hydrolase (TIGR01549 family)